MMWVSLHDYENNRAILAVVPEYLANANVDGDDIATAIMTALGLSVGNCDYMIGVGITPVMENATALQQGEHVLESLVQDFKADALEALSESL